MTATYYDDGKDVESDATFEENDPALFNVRFLCETFKFLYNKMTNYATSGIFGQLSY